MKSNIREELEKMLKQHHRDVESYDENAAMAGNPEPYGEFLDQLEALLSDDRDRSEKKLKSKFKKFLKDVVYLTISDYSGSDPSEQLMYEEMQKWNKVFNSEFKSTQGSTKEEEDKNGR